VSGAKVILLDLYTSNASGIQPLPLVLPPRSLPHQTDGVAEGAMGQGALLIERH